MIDKTRYRSNLEILENFLDFAIDISDKISGQFVPWYLVRANQLYTRITMTTMSIIHLLPMNRYFPSKFEFWDFFSVASLTRNLIENYHMLYYVAFDKITDEEREFRILHLTYHLNNEKYKYYSEMGEPASVLEEFEQNLPLAKVELENHSFFPNLSLNQKKKVINGRDSMYLTHKEISERIPFAVNEFKGIYRLFSNHTHSSPLAYFSMNNERGRGLENQIEIDYLDMAIDLCIKYLSAAMVNIVSKFPDVIEKLDQLKHLIVIGRYSLDAKQKEI